MEPAAQTCLRGQTMSLTVALNNALSGLKLSQASIEITSRNVGNANTPGYTRKTLQYESTAVGGVVVTGVQRQVDEALQKELQVSDAKVSNLQTLQEYLSRMTQTLGSPSDGGRITQPINALAAAFETLAGDPASYAASTQARDQLVQTADSIAEASQNVQDLRTQIESDIPATISEINDLLTKISDMNDRIVIARSRGGAIEELQDGRDEAIRQLGELVPVTTYDRTDGRMVVSLTNGIPLVDDHARLLDTYQGRSVVTPGQEYGSNPFGGSFSTISFVNLPGVDLSASIKGGKLGALVELRDVELPAVQDQLDNLASMVKDQLNRAHNLGASLDREGPVIGSRTFEDPATSEVTITGDIRFVVFDANGANVGNVTLAQTTPATAYTVDDLATAIDGLLGGGGYGSASVTSDGQLSITPGAGYRIAVLELDAGTDTAKEASVAYDLDGNGTADQTVPGFSNFFGLNDLLTTNQTGPAYRSSSTLTANQTATVNFTVTIPGGTVTFPNGTSTGSGSGTAASIVDQINNDTALDALGIKASLFRSGDSYGIRLGRTDGEPQEIVVTDNTTSPTPTLSFLRSELGSSFSLDVRSDIADNPRLIARGMPLEVDANLAPTSPSPYYEVGSGDATVANQLAKVFTDTFSFKSVSGLQGVQATLAGYSGQVTGYIATTASKTESDLATEQQFNKVASDRYSAASEVNIDEELSNLIRYQFLYSASARVMNVVNEMFNTLESIVGR